MLAGSDLERYDSHGVFSSPRALFMFRSFGHENSSIIDGGLPRWVDEGLQLDTAAPSLPEPGTYGLPKFKEDAVKSNLQTRFTFKFFFSRYSS
jgi:thiosulfate/3-mercaptopyruvate sulfurtransferase